MSGPSEPTPAAFSGFPREALDFYRGVAAHNDEAGRAWFEAHRDDYLGHVIAPAQAFIVALGEKLRASRPAVGYAPDHNGRGSFKKIHTDRRFRKDRPPFKTYAQMFFWEGPLKTKKANSTYVVHLEPERVVVGAGLYYFEGPLLGAYREAAASADRGAALGDIVERLAAAGYQLGGAHYKRVPRGYPADHPRAGLLRHASIFGYVEATPEEAGLHDAGFVDWCHAHHAALTPLHAWCVDLLRGAVG